MIKKKIGKGIVAFSLSLIMAIAMPIVSYAKVGDVETPLFVENDLTISTEDEQLESISESLEEVIENNIEHSFDSQILSYYLSYEIDEPKSIAEEEADNTDPNYAYIITNGSVIQGTIENANEFRWYAFVLNVTSKYSIWLQMVSTLDADLYIFEYDSTTGQLGLIGGSATDGAGVAEFSTDVLTAGIYFVAVSGYESTGNFAFAYCESTADVEYEVNDTLSSATTISLSTDITGVIDNPYDFDFYKFTLTAPTIVRYSISSTDDYVLAYAGSTGSAPTIIDGTLIKMPAGTYTFAVYSPTGSYSTSSTYTINFNKIGEYADESVVPLRAISEPAGIVFQTNLSGTICYVNGHPIDISYQYDYSNSNSGGSESYHISLNNMEGVRCQIWREEGQFPSVDYYLTSTRPAKIVESKPVLKLMFYTADTSVHFYNINCIGTGAYRDNTCVWNPPYVIVDIDPDDGKLIDICEPNFFYDYAIGSNYISSVPDYFGYMSFNYCLYDYVN